MDKGNSTGVYGDNFATSDKWPNTGSQTSIGIGIITQG